MEERELESIRKLKLDFLADNYEEFLKKVERKPRETILWWLKKEQEFLTNKSETNRIKKAKLGTFVHLNEVDWSVFQSPTDLKIQITNLIEKNCVTSKRNVVFIGAEGIGKTMLSKNIAFQLLKKGYSALFTTVSAMVDDFNSSDNSYIRRRILAKYVTPNILILDELGYISFHEKSADTIFEVISKRYDEKMKSTIVTSNQAFIDWGKVLGNSACVTSIVDRLIHHCSVINIEAPSFRLKEHKKDTFNA